ncbi:B-box zinc finger protein 18-like, partial [Cucurbita moschata]|uniref:B-box zinc finger protein 18-like n=1 Tax=Cucurbita moschata TaxID=3662 RepID=A0A6J1EUC6_CUCMO
FFWTLQKRTHKRYLLLRQRVEFPGDKPINLDDPSPHSKVSSDISKGHNLPPPHKVTVEDNQQNHHRLSPVRDRHENDHTETDTKMIDLNMKPQRVHGQAANNQDL